MPTARKLPSGSWRCLVYDYTDENGKRIYRSFTSADSTKAGKKEAERMAAEWAVTKETESRQLMALTVEQAIRNYIRSKENTLSQSTLRGYISLEKNYFEEII